MTGLVISKAELDRLRAESGLKSSPVDVKTQLSDSTLHQQSKQRSLLFKNTTAITNEQQLGERQKRLAKAEELQKRIDELEEEKREEERNLTLADAGHKLFKCNDQIRRFASAMMLSDVMAERDQQIRIKRELDALSRIRDDKYHELLKHNVYKMEERERALRELESQKREDLKQSQLEQLRAQQQRWLLERRMKHEEGARVRQMDIEMLKEEDDLAMARKNNEKAANKETKLAQKYLREVTAKMAQRERLEDEAIQQLASKKDEMNELRKQRMQDIHNQKQRVREKLIEEQAARLAAVQKTEDELCEKQARDFLENETKAEEQRIIRARKCRDDLNECRRVQIAEKSERKQQERAVDDEAAQKTTALLKIMDSIQLEEADRRSQAQKSLQRAILLQIARKEHARRTESEKWHQSVSKGREDTLDYKQEILEYMKRYLDEYKADGRNIVPLLKSMSDLYQDN
jgi:hypothetical protein